MFISLKKCISDVFVFSPFVINLSDTYSVPDLKKNKSFGKTACPKKTTRILQGITDTKAEMANQAQLQEINSKELNTLASDMKKVAKLV